MYVYEGCDFVLIATSDEDFAFSPQVLTFPAGSVVGNTQCIQVTILTDDSVEGDETFMLNLGSPGPLVVLDPNFSSATVSILNIDSKFSYPRPL